MPLVRGVTVDANEIWTAELGIQFNVQNLFEIAALEFEAYALHFSEPALETTVSDLFQLIKTASERGWTIDQMSNAIDTLWGKYLSDTELSDQERSWFQERQPRFRRDMIARTESMKAANFGSSELFRAYGAAQHEWLATNDLRTRTTHMLADGQIRTIGQPFEVGNSLMLHPLDSSLGADAGEIVNCRCVTVPVFAEDIMPF